MDWVSTVASPGVIVGLKGERWRQQGDVRGWLWSKVELEKVGQGLSGWTHLGCSRHRSFFFSQRFIFITGSQTDSEEITSWAKHYSSDVFIVIWLLKKVVYMLRPLLIDPACFL